jgi:1-acyl-sn-glycerol-3-phosphate acyltransferase
MPTSALNRTLAAGRTGVFLISAIVILLVLWPMLALRIETAPVRRAYFRFIARLLGLKLSVQGRPATARPMLFVCNHISYLDIVVLGAMVEAEFVSRADLAHWPLFGVMAKAGSTVFIDRRRHSTGKARDQMQQRIGRHRALVMFPESTSGDGNHMLPFKSALFTVAESGLDGAKTMVQPISIAYTRLNGMPIGVGWRPYWASWGGPRLRWRSMPRYRPIRSPIAKRWRPTATGSSRTALATSWPDVVSPVETAGFQ